MFFCKKKIIIIYICQYTIINIMKDYILKCGLIVGFIQVTMLFLSYFFGIDLMLSTWWGVSQFMISLFLVVYFGIQIRKAKNNVLSFKDSFKVSFGIYACAGFILTFFNILLYNFIDVEFATIAKEKVIESTYQMMQDFGASDNVIDDAIIEIEKQDSFSISTLAKGYFFGLPLYIIISLIISAFIKKNPIQDTTD